MNFNIQKAKSLIEEHENIEIITPERKIKGAFPGALSLFYSLKNLNKNVNFNYINFPSEFNFLIHKKRFYAQGNLLISINRKSLPYQIYYQKNSGHINLYLKNGKGIQKEDIKLKNLNSNILGITIGIQQKQKAQRLFSNPSQIKNIINIDIDSENERFGQINLTESSESFLSGTIFSLIESVDNNLWEEYSANSLLAAITKDTLNFKKPIISQRVSYLTEKGGNLSYVISRLYNLQSQNPLALCQRASGKINFSPEENLSWVTLTDKDFKEADASPRDLSFILDYLKRNIFEGQNFLCLWEGNPHSTDGIFYSPSEDTAEKIKKELNGNRKNKGVLLKISNKTPSEVKQEVRNTLRE